MDMQSIVGRSITVALGSCLALTTLATQAALPPPVSAESDDVAGWTKLWHPAFRPRLGAGTSQENVQWLGDRFAIVGGDDRGAVVWWSDDGLEWERTPSRAATEHGVGVSIAGGPEGYVLGGYQWSPTPRGRLWQSTDGREWVSSESKLPPGSEVRSVAAMADGTFVAYGYDGRREGCWMGSSADGGATWDFRWKGDWDPGTPEGCATSVVADEEGLLARIGLDNISESTDGVTWREVVSGDEIRAAQPQSSRRWVDAGLVPLGDGRFVLGGKGTRTLAWSRDGGLERIEGPVDWSGLWPIGVALGGERAVAVKRDSAAPLVSPPTDVHAEPWAPREPVCRPNRPRIEHIAAMRPAERLTCYGDRELTFEAWVPMREYGGICEFGPPHSWMICEDYWLASGPGTSPAWLDYAFAPNARVAKGADSWGRHVRVTGHFDDPAARQCPEPGWDGTVPEGWREQTRSDFVRECRQKLIVTDMRRIED
jgi:hypothetical protein